MLLAFLSPPSISVRSIFLLLCPFQLFLNQQDCTGLQVGSSSLNNLYLYFSYFFLWNPILRVLEMAVVILRTKINKIFIPICCCLFGVIGRCSARYSGYDVIRATCFCLRAAESKTLSSLFKSYTNHFNEISLSIPVFQELSICNII